jgi:hypothetical protein
MTPITVALISFFTAVVVAVVTHILSARRKARDELSEMRLRAYTDFVSATSRIVAARRLGQTTDELDDLAVLNDAKARICICAESSVVRALSDFWSHGGTLERETEILAFTRLCSEIRKSLGAREFSLREPEISSTLFQLEPSGFSVRASRRQQSG